MSSIMSSARGGNSTNNPQTWYTLREASDYLRISTRSLLRAMSKGRLRRNKINGRYLFRRNWLDQYACGFGQQLSKSQQSQIKRLFNSDDDGGKQNG